MPPWFRQKCYRILGRGTFLLNRCNCLFRSTNRIWKWPTLWKERGIPTILQKSTNAQQSHGPHHISHRTGKGSRTSHWPKFSLTPLNFLWTQDSNIRCRLTIVCPWSAFCSHSEQWLFQLPESFLVCWIPGSATKSLDFFRLRPCSLNRSHWCRIFPPWLKTKCTLEFRRCPF